MFWQEWTPVSALSVKVTSHDCDENIVEKERSIEAVGFEGDGEKGGEQEGTKSSTLKEAIILHVLCRKEAYSEMEKHKWKRTKT